MIHWDLKIVHQKEIRKCYLERILYQVLDTSAHRFQKSKNLLWQTVPPKPFQQESGPIPLDSPSDMFNYLRKTHLLREPVINMNRVSALNACTASLQNRLIVTLLTGTSLTVRHIAVLRVADFIPERKMILLPRKENAWRSCHLRLSTRVTELFKALVAGRQTGEFLFQTAKGKPFKPSTLQAIYSQTLKRAGI